MGQAVLAAQSLAETLLTGLTTLSRTRNPASSVELTSGRTSLQTRLANHTGRTSRLASQVLAGQAQAVFLPGPATCHALDVLTFL